MTKQKTAFLAFFLFVSRWVPLIQPRPQAYTRYASEPSYQPEAWNRARLREAWQKK